MSKTSTETRQTVTTTYRFDPYGATLRDLRDFVKQTEHLLPGSPIQTQMFTSSLEVHQTLEPAPEDLGESKADPSNIALKIADELAEKNRRGIA